MRYRLACWAGLPYNEFTVIILCFMKGCSVMNIEGTYTLQAEPEEVWRCLLDEHVLRRAMPGVERLEQENSERYSITMHIRQAPLVGLYQGHVTITNQQYPYQYRLSIEGEGKQSKISGEGIILLNRHAENTVVSYKGTLNAGTLVTLLPPPLVQGAAKLLIQQFFTALAEHLRTMSRVETVASTVTTSWNTPEAHTDEQKIPANNGSAREHTHISTPDAPPPAPVAAQLPFPLALVRRFTGENGASLVDSLRGVRARRFGILVALLVLVWVGTRIPKFFHLS